MRIGAIGYNHSHGSDFELSYPEGPGCWLFLLVRTPADFMIAGEELRVERNSFLLLSKDTPCRYRAAQEVYADDWLFAAVEPGDEERLKEFGVPCNRPAVMKNFSELSQLMHIMTCEHYSADCFHERIEAKYFEIFLMQIGRMVKEQGTLSSKLLLDRNTKLTHLRARIFNAPDELPGVDGMAAEVGMSRSGFQHLYKRVFGVHVMEDVIAGRTECAKRLLATTRLPVREVGMRCGYANEYSFMRQFKERTGMTPSEYRNKGGLL